MENSGLNFDWFIPLSEKDKTLKEVYAELASFGDNQGSIPLIVQLVENPKFDIPGFDIFNGATSLQTHDYIHILLGRGILPKDEAFVIGFTMGSTNRVSSLEEKLYGLISKYLYPKEFQFSDSDFDVFKDALRLGFISDCQPLNTVDYEALMPLSLEEARKAIGIESSLIRAYYEIEQRRYPDERESQRLLQGF
ncbi:hypothetical protein [Thalassolituus sp.]|uniref:hypothetical protein n=1 Tax=Thalassolituus sp. TaxID=2030822 RepID=UPI0035153D93